MILKRICTNSFALLFYCNIHTHLIHKNSRLCNNNRFNIYQYFTPINCRVSIVDLFEFYVRVCTSAGKQHRIQTTAEKFMNEIFKSTFLSVYAYSPAYSVSLSLFLSAGACVECGVCLYTHASNNLSTLSHSPHMYLCESCVCSCLSSIRLWEQFYLATDFSFHMVGAVAGCLLCSHLKSHQKI